MQYIIAFLAIVCVNTTYAIEVVIAPSYYKIQNQTLLELNFQYLASSVSQNTLPPLNESQIQMSVILTAEIYRKDSLVKVEKARINAAFTDVAQDFLDIRRYVLEAGEYKVNLNFQDFYDTSNVLNQELMLTVPKFKDKQLQMSSILLLANMNEALDEQLNSPFYKSGLIVEPLPHLFYKKSQEKMAYYVELYNINTQDEDLVLETNITKVSSLKDQTLFKKHFRLNKDQSVIPIAQFVDISAFPSGQYRILLQLYDKTLQPKVMDSVFFFISNPDYTDKIVRNKLKDVKKNQFLKMPSEKLQYSLRALAPVMASTEQDFINGLVKNGTDTVIGKYLWTHWVEKDPNAPMKAYEEYMKKIRAVDNKFYNAFGHGFETDRGRIYLKYGPPLQIATRENDHGALPYEIWTYDQIPYTNETNVKFVFYNPTLSGNDYILLHSSTRLELQNPRWLSYIYNVGDQTDPNGIEDGRIRDNYSREAARLFNDN